MSATATITDAAPDIRVPRYFVQPQTNEPRVFFEGALGAASLFERVEVLVNGQEVREEQMGTYGYLYATLNRLLMSKERRVSKYGRDIPRVSTGDEHDISLSPLPAALLASMESLQSAGKKESADQVHRFGFDGVWPFDSQSNLLWALTGQEATNGFLPPEMELTVRLHRRIQRTSLLQRAAQTDATVYSQDPAVVAAKNAVDFQIKDLVILYEVLTTDERTMEAMKRKTTYYVDVPRIGIDMVSGDKMFSHNVVTLPRGTKGVVLAWVWEDEVFLKSTSNKPLSARFFFPPNAVNVTVGFDGEPGLIFSHGFEELGTAKADNSLTSREYYRQLVHKGLYSRPYDKMFPGPSTKSYDGVLVFDLTAQNLKDGGRLHVHVKYDASKASKGYYLASFAVKQCEYTYTHLKQLVCQLVV